MKASISPQTSDVLVIGGGVVGLATAYHLARLGASVRLLTTGDLGDGASACNAGRTQVNEGNLDAFSLSVITQSLQRLAGLKDELGMDVEWQRIGYVCLINSEKEMVNWRHRCPVLTAAGIPTEMMDRQALHEAEPHLNMDLVMGATYTTEGLLNPFLYSQAFARAARRLGVNLLPHTPVTGMTVSSGRVVEVQAGAERFSAGKVVVTCGSWTRLVAALAGGYAPVSTHHTEAFITESVPPIIFHMLGIADFYEVIHHSEQTVPIGLGPYPNGTILVAESVTRTDELHRRLSFWGLTALAAQLRRYFPSWERVRIVRGWGTATPFSPDEQPLLGLVPPLQNLYCASGFQQTICITPVVTDLLARVVLDQPVPVELEDWSPMRFAASANPN